MAQPLTYLQDPPYMKPKTVNHQPYTTHASDTIFTSIIKYLMKRNQVSGRPKRHTHTNPFNPMKGKQNGREFILHGKQIPSNRGQ